MVNAISREDIPHYTEWKVGNGLLFPFDNGNYCLGSGELFSGNLFLLERGMREDFGNISYF